MQSIDDNHVWRNKIVLSHSHSLSFSPEDVYKKLSIRKRMLRWQKNEETSGLDWDCPKKLSNIKNTKMLSWQEMIFQYYRIM